MPTTPASGHGSGHGPEGAPRTSRMPRAGQSPGSERVPEAARAPAFAPAPASGPGLLPGPGRRRHARPRDALLPGAVLRAAVVVASAGAVLGATGAAAAAAPAPAPAPRPANGLDAAAQGVGSGVAGALGPLKRLRLNPLAKTGVDPLDNTLGTRLGSFPPITTGYLTAPLARGDSLSDLPGIDPVVQALPG